MNPENLKTEEDASRIFCHTTIATPGRPLYCSTSSCMAWMWAGWRTKNGKVVGRCPDGERVGDRLGYCGRVEERKA